MAPLILDAAALRRVLVGYHGALSEHREAIDNLNVYPVPDGDTGTNMTLTVRSVTEGLDGVDDRLEPLCKAVAHLALMGARGNSGVILAQILRGFSSVLRDADSAGQEPDAPVVARALSAASEGAYTAVARPVEGTILTVIREASESAQAAAEAGGGLVEVLDAARVQGYDALERTPEMLAVLAEAGVVDAGGAGLLLLLDACLAELDGRPLPEPPKVAAGPAPVAAASAAHPIEESSIADLRYEVMFLLDAPDSSVDGFKQAWIEVGDSIVVVGGDGIWNCHIHTDDIGAAIEAGIAVGRPHRIQITDLLDQAAEHSESFSAPAPPGMQDEAGDSPPARADITEAEGCSVVAVGAGAGVVEILKSMGAHRVVAGGQSMNPSTAELLAAVESLPTGHVVVLPNNKKHHPGGRASRRPDRQGGERGSDPQRRRGDRQPDGVRAVGRLGPEPGRPGRGGRGGGGRRGDSGGARRLEFCRSHRDGGLARHRPRRHRGRGVRSSRGGHGTAGRGHRRRP